MFFVHISKFACAVFADRSQLLRNHRDELGQMFLCQDALLEHVDDEQFQLVGVEHLVAADELPLLEILLTGVVAEPARLGGHGDHL